MTYRAKCEARRRRTRHINVGAFWMSRENAHRMLRALQEEVALFLDRVDDEGRIYADPSGSDGGDS